MRVSNKIILIEGSMYNYKFKKNILMINKK
jgi:hypothetical protein